MWPPSPSAPRRPLPTGTVLGVDYSTVELRTLGNLLTSPPCDPSRPGMAPDYLSQVGIDPSRADELAAAYRLGGTAALAQALDAARVDP